MTDFLNAVGLFAKSNFPGDNGPNGAIISVKAGLAANLTEAGGGIKAVYAYDADNQYLGEGKGGSVAEGGLFSSTVDQGAPDTQADFVDVTFDNDAVCVAWITVKMHDGSPGGAWTGDVGSFCGETWYTQTQEAGKDKDGNPYVPRCTWFDGDHTTGSHASMKFRTRAYGENAGDTISNNHACQSTIYGVDNTPVEGTPAKRDVSIRPQWMTEQLIISSIEQHSAKELCESATSWGPDFVDSKGQYCDMGTKTLTPLCSAEQIEGCLTIDGNALKKRSSVGKREVHLAKKTYERVMHW
ncbi:hypothetical protein CB0940_08758 [Cercospora beticola]|uniref:Uncharacterized protein n=1 Tax=Cercospora beticola TaxID=122368 RepID=A0A2G5HPP5_CERBT|nr:hypothetical protein CB0940_08758 [Cercospora beticola]PIA94527.1 hypothetical protein CB0940_08758 [Cercospora beticola]WPB05342.1 hypothetical protein RHO25_009994 [Cercospora beticola]CAK1365144.1 unnamed protein product [Cercospora beticola]